MRPVLIAASANPFWWARLFLPEDDRGCAVRPLRSLLPTRHAVRPSLTRDRSQPTGVTSPDLQVLGCRGEPSLAPAARRARAGGGSACFNPSPACPEHEMCEPPFLRRPGQDVVELSLRLPIP